LSKDSTADERRQVSAHFVFKKNEEFKKLNKNENGTENETTERGNVLKFKRSFSTENSGRKKEKKEN
jgi:hypothetical protein